MPIRNPFSRRPGVVAQDENARDTNGPRLIVEPPGFERVDTVGSKASSLSTGSSRTNDAGAYKLSGTVFPPSSTPGPFLTDCPAISATENPSSAIVAPVADV